MKKNLMMSFAAAAILSTTTIPAISNLPIIRAVHSHTANAATMQTEFLNRISSPAQKVAKKYGIYPSVMIAQAIVESNWGQSRLATTANNLFGIKSNDTWTGESLTAKTREETSAGKSYYINAAFNKYNSYQASLDNYGKLIRLGVSWQPTIYQGAWLENATSYNAATKTLTGTYATDCKYDQSLNSKIVQYNLTQYDPILTKVNKSYQVGKNASTYNWPTDHVVTTKNGSVKKGQKVNVDQIITYHNGSKRMHITGSGWVNSTIFKKKTSLPVIQSPKNSGIKVNKYLMHNAYIYDEKGKKVAGVKTIKEDNVVTTYGIRNINKKKYYQIGQNQYIAAGNIDGTFRLLKHGTYVYNGSGNRDNSLVYKKNASLNTYGGRVTIIGKKYYKIGINQYVKAANFNK